MIDNDDDTQTEEEVADTALADEPRQEEMPFAVVEGVAMTELPRDLYIPPNALEVFLEAFEGPLDLLLYLIKRQNLNILDIPIAEITRQYMEYVDVMKDLRLELAAEYLVMAAMLAEIKSRMLLPRSDPESEEEGDPRAELIRRLQEYERYKKAAEELDSLPRVGRDVFPTEVVAPHVQVVRRQPTVRVEDLLMALSDVFRRARMEGFIVVDYVPRFAEAESVMQQWIDEGRLKYRSTVVDGFENLPKALIKLFAGENIGKMTARA